MVIINEAALGEFFLDKNYDLRKSGNGRWIDQKCTPDVICIIADCILEYLRDDYSKVFYTNDIWESKYANENIFDIFSKPSTSDKSARNEYDKFFGQPLKMFANAGILRESKQSNKNTYVLQNKDILEYIALREKNAMIFLQKYIKKVLEDSEIYYFFEDFFVQQNKSSFTRLKNGYSDFIIKYTKINKPLECNRIFTKVLNPLAFGFKKLGTERGHISSHKITYDMLMYNRDNFRDVYLDKPKDVSRKDYINTAGVSVNKNHLAYQSTKAKKYLRLFNDTFRGGKTEHLEESHLNDSATNMHHIFLESEFPEISYYLENLIALTPTQHYNYAHPMNNTHIVSEEYQQLLLLSKVDIVEWNLNQDKIEKIYDFGNMVYVLRVGFENEDIEKIENDDFDAIRIAINTHYQ